MRGLPVCTRPGGPWATAACGIDGFPLVIHPAIALAEGETTGWNGCIRSNKEGYILHIVKHEKGFTGGIVDTFIHNLVHLRYEHLEEEMTRNLQLAPQGDH